MRPSSAPNAAPTWASRASRRRGRQGRRRRRPSGAGKAARRAKAGADPARLGPQARTEPSRGPSARPHLERDRRRRGRRRRRRRLLAGRLGRRRRRQPGGSYERARRPGQRPLRPGRRAFNRPTTSTGRREAFAPRRSCTRRRGRSSPATRTWAPTGPRRCSTAATSRAPSSRSRRVLKDDPDFQTGWFNKGNYLTHEARISRADGPEEGRQEAVREGAPGLSEGDRARPQVGGRQGGRRPPRGHPEVTFAAHRPRLSPGRGGARSSVTSRSHASAGAPSSDVRAAGTSRPGRELRRTTTGGRRRRPVYPVRGRRGERGIGDSETERDPATRTRAPRSRAALVGRSPVPPGLLDHRPPGRLIALILAARRRRPLRGAAARVLRPAGPLPRRGRRPRRGAGRERRPGDSRSSCSAPTATSPSARARTACSCRPARRPSSSRACRTRTSSDPDAADRHPATGSVTVLERVEDLWRTLLE